MPIVANGGPGGMVNECVNIMDQTVFSMGATVQNMGSADSNYSVLFAASQAGAIDTATGKSDQTQMGIVLAGTEIRLCDISSDGTCSIVVSIQRSCLTTAQKQQVHISFGRGPNHRTMYFDGVIPNDGNRTGDDTTVQTASQTTSNVVVNYGVGGPVALGKLQMMGGFITSSDAKLMMQGQDVRDIVYNSGGRLSVNFEFPLAKDYKEITGLYPGFLNNSTNAYAELLEVDVNQPASFGSNAVPSVTWTGNGAVLPALAVPSY